MAESVVVKLDPHNAAQEAKERNLHIPPALHGRRATLADAEGKQYGSMAPDIDKQFEEFLEIASRHEAKVLEIGAAYGSPYLMKAFEQDSPAEYTALDILPDQLKILARRIEELHPSKLSRLTLIGGAFPRKEVVNELQEGGYDAVLASRVFQFLMEDEFFEAFRQIHRLLKPGGKLFVKLATPYFNILDPSYRVKVTNDIRNFLDSADRKNHPLPGFIESLAAVVNKSIDEKTLKELGVHQGHVLFCDKEILKFVLESTGFKIETIEYSPCQSFPLKLDGREYVIVIAQQKSDH